MCNKLLFSILFFICTNGFAQTTLYVDSAAIGNNNGSNWSNAFTSLTKALDSAWRNTGIDSILVAKGNYTPMYFPYQMISGGTGDTMTSLSDNRQRVFHIRQGLELYGGYNATTGSRNISFNQTVLNGAHVGGVVNDSAYHVVLADSSLHWQNILDSTVIDGFKIMNGVANSSGNTTVNNNVIWNYHGAGLYVTLQSGFNLSNCTISYNSGIQYASGAYINCAYGKVFFDNNIVNFNTGPSEAIGIDCHYDEKNSVIINSDISNNNNGGGLRIGCFNSPLIVRNNTFRNNTGIAGVFGGLKIQGSGPNNIIVTNNEISSNIGGIEISASNNSVLTIENNTIKNNNGLGWTNAGIDIFCPTGTLYFNNNSILNNIGTDGGGEIASYGGVVYLNGNIFNNNSATGGAGGLTISTTAGTSILNKNIFSNNSSTATNSAGGLHIGYL